MRPTIRSPGTSAAVITATTPGAAAARLVSIRRTTARGWSLKRSAACSIPGAVMSATNGCSPSAIARPAMRSARAPTPPGTPAGLVGGRLPAAGGHVGAASPRRVAATASTASRILT